MAPGWGGILLLAVIGVGFGIVSVVISRFLGPRNPTPEKLAPYECGMPPVGDARERQSVKFYMICMIFLMSAHGTRVTGASRMNDCFPHASQSILRLFSSLTQIVEYVCRLQAEGAL